MAKNILLVFFLLIFFTGCMLIKDSKKKDDCPAYTYNVVEGDSIRYVKDSCCVKKINGY
tara:strand:+ start:477 stop:653 length:177 start_codon:yes stop_codon:yes gene_type:complete